MCENKPVPGRDGNRYIPYEERSGGSTAVYFTRDLSEKGLIKVFDRVSSVLEGRIAVKLHTGEAEGPNIIPRPWVKELIKTRLPEAVIIETNTYYEGSRYTTEEHRRTLEINGWNFCPVDITDEDGVAALPVKGGKWFKEMHVGKNMLNYDSMLALTHFKGHTMGGFGGSNKNIGIGCADGRIGKKEIHTKEGSSNMWSIAEEELMERISESTKATIDFFAPHVCYVNVMRNMSVSCDCEGAEAEPVVTPDIGIVASPDILAADSACVDLLYSLPDGGGKHMIERVETRHGLRQLSYMHELGMGRGRYALIDTDNGDAVITAAEAVKDIAPDWKPDKYNTFPGRNKPNLTSVSDFFEWRADRNQPSVEDYYSEYTTNLGWEETDVLYSFLGVYVLGLIAFYPDQFRIAKYRITQNESGNYAYSKLFLSTHYGEYSELNDLPELKEFLSMYFDIGNVIPIWKGGNSDKGMHGNCFDNPDIYFKSNINQFKELVRKFPTAYMEDLIISPYEDTPSLLKQMYSSKDEYLIFLRHIIGVISKRTEQLSIQ